MVDYGLVMLRLFSDIVGVDPLRGGDIDAIGDDDSNDGAAETNLIFLSSSLFIALVDVGIIVAAGFAFWNWGDGGGDSQCGGRQGREASKGRAPREISPQTQKLPPILHRKFLPAFTHLILLVRLLSTLCLPCFLSSPTRG